MPHAFGICGKEFSTKADLVRHRDTIHGDVTGMPSGEEILDAETGQNRSADIFYDTDNSSDEATTELLPLMTVKSTATTAVIETGPFHSLTNQIAALPRYGYNIEYSKERVPEQTLMKKYGYLVLK
ncbi:hypothetical protein Bbelb_361900 [Branchiostoma belcheri]|nr:hypothetical protein Bbelb_361900 [Branchiostoma belcheri]